MNKFSYRGFFFSFLFLDDPYYCGLSARVPNFVKLSANRTKPLPKETRESVRGYPMPSYGVPPHPPPLSFPPSFIPLTCSVAVGSSWKAKIIHSLIISNRKSVVAVVVTPKY